VLGVLGKHCTQAGGDSQYNVRLLLIQVESKQGEVSTGRTRGADIVGKPAQDASGVGEGLTQVVSTAGVLDQIATIPGKGERQPIAELPRVMVQPDQSLIGIIDIVIVLRIIQAYSNASPNIQ